MTHDMERRGFIASDMTDKQLTDYIIRHDLTHCHHLIGTVYSDKWRRTRIVITGEPRNIWLKIQPVGNGDSIEHCKD